MNDKLLIVKLNKINNFFGFLCNSIKYVEINFTDLLLGNLYYGLGVLGWGYLNLSFFKAF
jgi:hypothetical protein